MAKVPLSVTLDKENVVWLRGQVRTSRRRSLSETLDALVTEARTGGRVHNEAVRSVVGTIDINEADPQLVEADAYVRGLYVASVRPSLQRKASVRESSSRSRSRARNRRP